MFTMLVENQAADPTPYPFERNISRPCILPFRGSDVRGADLDADAPLISTPRKDSNVIDAIATNQEIPPPQLHPQCKRDREL